MSAHGKSRQSFSIILLLLIASVEISGQQKANDFTKRVGIFDGKMSSLSGRASKFNRLSPSSSRRISLEEWPVHFSPFGGKRFPVGNVKILGKERIDSSKIDIKTPLNDQIATENFKRVENPRLSTRNPAANAVEFRDAYYARLNDRVDEWMEKVNNMSLRDINRYQFRPDRSIVPGFPVQRAGAAGMDGAVGQAPLKGSGLPTVGEKVMPSTKQYWMGPKKVKSSHSSTLTSPNKHRSEYSTSNQSDLPSRNFKASPKPILGPKTIRVQVGTPE